MALSSLFHPTTLPCTPSPSANIPKIEFIQKFLGFLYQFHLGLGVVSWSLNNSMLTWQTFGLFRCFRTLKDAKPYLPFWVPGVCVMPLSPMVLQHNFRTRLGCAIASSWTPWRRRPPNRAAAPCPQRRCPRRRRPWRRRPWRSRRRPQRRRRPRHRGRRRQRRRGWKGFRMSWKTKEDNCECVCKSTL